MAHDSNDHMDALRASIATQFQLDKTNAKKTVDAVLDGLKDILISNIKDPGFRLATKIGIFEHHTQKAKVGRNPGTGAKINIAPKAKIVFKPTKDIRDAGL